MSAAEKSKMMENGGRIAKNASILYLRMLVLTLVGLFTSRIVLRELGVDDYGIWTAVGGVVTIFTFVTNSIATAISRFLAYELGRSDSARLRRVFASSLTVQLLLCLVLILLVEGVGMWFLNEKMVLPVERMHVARFILHCSLAVLLLNMLSVPYNAAIVAYEKLSVFAWISIVEGVLKLTIALLLSLSLFDKLQTYALLMVAVAVIIRMAYGLYCRRNFEETRTGPVYDRPVLRELLGFASWSFIGGSANVLNIHGSNLLVNLFFGVALNAAKGLSVHVEALFKQLASNILNALNPHITKSWASGDKEYCFAVVAKGIKFICLAMLLLFVPIELESELLLSTWLKEVPPGTVIFVRLGLIAVFIDMAAGPLHTLILATGKIKNYYKVVSFNYLFFLLLMYLAFRLGGAVHWVYICLIGLYTGVSAMKLSFAKINASFPLWKLFKKVLLPLIFLGLFAFAIALVPRILLPEGFVRLLLVCILAWITIFVLSFFFIMTPGERSTLSNLFS